MKSSIDQTYPYSSTLHLDRQPSYSYSRFDGIGFLAGFLSARESFLGATAPREIKNMWDKSHLVDLVAQLSELPDFKLAGREWELWMGASLPNTTREVHSGRTHQGNRNSSTLEVEKFLEGLLCGCVNQSTVITLSVESIDNAVKLLHRFEVDGRIYSIYGAGLRNGWGTYNEVRLHLLMSVLFSICYALTQNLQFLSSLLKVGDLLTAPVFNRGFAEHAALGGLALRLERALVEGFLEKHGIKFGQ